MALQKTFYSFIMVPCIYSTKIPSKEKKSLFFRNTERVMQKTFKQRKFITMTDKLELGLCWRPLKQEWFMLRLMSDIHSFCWQTFFSTSHQWDGVPAQRQGFRSLISFCLIQSAGQKYIWFGLKLTIQDRIFAYLRKRSDYYVWTFLIFVRVSCSSTE